MMRKLQNSVKMSGTVLAAALAMVGIVGFARIVDIALEQQAHNQGRRRGRATAPGRLGVVAIGLQRVECAVGDEPARIRAALFFTSSSIPGTAWSKERVAMMPSTHGILIA